MNLLKSVTLAIGWLSGSLAGLGAILYAFGYLITRAQLNLLGIEGLLAYSTDHFIQEGAKFVIVVAELIIRVLLVLALIVFLVRGSVYLLLRARAGARLVRLRSAFASANVNLKALHQHVPWPLEVSCYGLLLCVLLFLHFFYYGQEFAAPLDVSNVLYLAVTSSTPMDSITKSVLVADSEQLQAYFRKLVGGEVYVALLFFVAWRLTSRLKLHRWLITPFLATLILYTLYLPMAYGVLVRPTRYNLITLHFVADTPVTKSGSFFLLNKSDQEFIVWDAALKRVLWIPKGAVAHAEIMHVEGLFKREARQP